MWRMSEGMFFLNVIPLLWGTVRERALAKGFSFDMDDAEVPVYLQKNEAKGQRDRQRSQRMCDYETCVVLCLFSFKLLPEDFSSWAVKAVFEYNVALCPQRPYGLGTGTPRRLPRL